MAISLKQSWATLVIGTAKQELAKNQTLGGNGYSILGCLHCTGHKMGVSACSQLLVEI